jgi:thymidylate synthase (FAD)
MKTVNCSTVEYVEHMGTDLAIVNAARVSFDKESDWADEEYPQILSSKDEKLINYLAKHNHWSPFAHTSISLRISTPIFVARQLGKHQVGLVWNEVSRRYVDEEPTFFFPDVWRKRAENVKQGSSKEEYTNQYNLTGAKGSIIETLVYYKALIADGVAPEQARMILPQNMMTTFIWTGSMLAFHRVFKQRTDSHAQKEVQDVAVQIGGICAELFPVSWKALNGDTK